MTPQKAAAPSLGWREPRREQQTQVGDKNNNPTSTAQQGAPSAIFQRLEALKLATTSCARIARSLEGEEARGAELCLFSLRDEVAKLLAQLGAANDQPSPVLLEREAVMRVVRRHVHSSHFGRIRAAVDSDAKARGAA